VLHYCSKGYCVPMWQSPFTSHLSFSTFGLLAVQFVPQHIQYYLIQPSDLMPQRPECPELSHRGSSTSSTPGRNGRAAQIKSETLGDTLAKNPGVFTHFVRTTVFLPSWPANASQNKYYGAGFLYSTTYIAPFIRTGIVRNFPETLEKHM
jgi:hypothetical protein